MQKQNQIIILSVILLCVLFLSSFIILNNLFMNNNQANSNTKKLTVNEQIVYNADKFNLLFNGTRSFTYLKDQVDIGFRPPNSTGIAKTRVLIVNQLEKFNWTVIFNNFTYMGVPSCNILAFPAGSTRKNISLFGAHYDTRWWADQDLNASNRHKPVLGANDGASGVAVLMEYAQIFAHRKDIALLFIDAEDQGGIDGWVYGAGAYEFTNSTVLNSYFPDGKSDIRLFLLFDMIGDWHLNIKKEQFSNRVYNNQIWSIADKLYYGTIFTNDPGYFIIDDHQAFLDAGISAVDLIDYDYTDQNGLNLHHTTHDTLQYVSATSLAIVGQTVEYWIASYDI